MLGKVLFVTFRILKLLGSLAGLVAVFYLALAIARCAPVTNGIDLPNHSDSSIQDLPEEFKLLSEVWTVLNDRHLRRDEFDAQQFSRDAIRGLLQATGEPHDGFLAPDQFAAQSDDFSGRFSGIGAEVTMKNGRPMVISPLPDTPAEAAGLRPGDIILAIDGESTEGLLSIFDAVFKIRGPRGTEVELLIQHNTGGDPISITIVRDDIKTQSVKFRTLVGGIAHLKITSFTESTEEELLEAIETFQRRQNRGLILDLRNNPGGLVDSAVGIASQFLDSGLVLYEIDGKGRRKDWKVRDGGLAKEIPMVVIVNGFSASSSEILAGALMDHQRAMTIGTKTFGKGSVNILYELSDGSGIYITIARFFTPRGSMIEGEGIEPDFLVEMTTDSADDLQLTKAIEILTTMIDGAE